MTVWVGSDPPVVYAGVITAVHAPTVEVLLTDDDELWYGAASIVATGTGAVNDKVSVLIQSTGRAIVVKS